jgi:hypothetical protein
MLFSFCFSAYISSAGCLSRLHSPMQKATGTTEDLRASQGGLYPPWSLMLSHIMVWGVFPVGFGLWVTNYEKRAKNPHFHFIQSGWRM